VASLSSIDITAQIQGIEWILLLIVAAVILLFGPQKLPELARGVGRALGEFRRGRMEVEREITQQFTAMDTQEGRTRIERAAEDLSGARVFFDFSFLVGFTRLVHAR